MVVRVDLTLLRVLIDIIFHHIEVVNLFMAVWVIMVQLHVSNQILIHLHLILFDMQLKDCSCQDCESLLFETRVVEAEQFIVMPLTKFLQ